MRRPVDMLMKITDSIVRGLLERREQALEDELLVHTAELRAEGVGEAEIAEILDLRRREHDEFTPKLKQALVRLRQKGR